jgi:hypothetical protein
MTRPTAQQIRSAIVFAILMLFVLWGLAGMGAFG